MRLLCNGADIGSTQGWRGHSRHATNGLLRVVRRAGLQLEAVEPVHVAAYVEPHAGSMTTVNPVPMPEGRRIAVALCI